MKIAFLSELNHHGYYDKSNPNQKLDVTWNIHLKSYHIPWTDVLINVEQLKPFDVILFTIPKTHPEIINYIIRLINKTKNTWILVQEGPCWYWQDFTTQQQTYYFELLQTVHGIFVHGESDQKYYEGLTGRKCFIIPTMIDLKYANKIPKLEKYPRSVLIGGNAGYWYSGEASASTVRNNPHIDKVFFPSMGRKKEDEEILMSVITDKEVQYFPYVDWTGFITLMSQAEYAVHLMSASAAGTFQINCALCGIPCIGNKLSDTQKILFPELAIDPTNIKKAANLLYRLTTSSKFKNDIIVRAKQNLKIFDVKTQIPIVLRNIEEVIKQRGT